MRCGAPTMRARGQGQGRLQRARRQSARGPGVDDERDGVELILSRTIAHSQTHLGAEVEHRSRLGGCQDDRPSPPQRRDDGGWRQGMQALARRRAAREGSPSRPREWSGWWPRRVVKVRVDPGCGFEGQADSPRQADSHTCALARPASPSPPTHPQFRYQRGRQLRLAQSPRRRVTACSV